jgi:hypothetical protein
VRISTTLEVLARATRGDRPETIAKTMHLPAGAVEKTLAAAGWPDLDAMATWQRTWAAEAHRDVWAVAETAEALANAARINPGWIHDYTATLGRQELRTAIAVMAAMLPRGVDCEEALAWKKETHPRNTGPQRLPTASIPKILAYAERGLSVEEISKQTNVKPESIRAVIEQARTEDAA